MLEIKGCIVTIDARDTQTDIAKSIIDNGADYILALKENQKTLYNDVNYIQRIYSFLNLKTITEQLKKGMERIETRKCVISDKIS